MSWPTNRTEFGPNRTPVLVGLGYQDEKSIVPIAVDETTGYLLTSTTVTPPALQNVNLTEVGGTAYSLGQKLSASSLSVTLASDTAALPVTQSGAWNVGLSAGSNTIGAISNSSFGATQSGNWNVGLNAGINTIGAISNTSFASTQSGSWTVGLSAGSNVIGSISNSSFAATQSGAWSVGTHLTTQTTGQTTSNTTAVQLSATSVAATNGIIVQALSGNTASVFVGVSGVSKTTGFELQAGQAIATSATNINVLYVIGSNSTDGVCWIVT